MSQSIQLGIQTYFSPDDDTQQVFLDFLSQAQHSIHIAIYSWHLPPAMDVIQTLLAGGRKIHLLMDHSQSTGKYEAPEVQELVQLGARVAIGTSRKHAILHDKYAVVDGLHVLSGSWNFSLSASQEANFLTIVSNPDFATLFMTNWQKQYDWIVTHEPQWQPPQGISSPRFIPPAKIRRGKIS